MRSNLFGASILVAILFSGPMSVSGQQSPRECSAIRGHEKEFSEVEKTVCADIKKIQDRKETDPKSGFFIGDDFTDILIFLIAKQERSAYVVEAEESRVDKQVGSAPSNSGSTSLVVKGSTPAILGLAVENGALSQTVSGTTVTFRGNPVGIINALANRGFIESFDKDSQDTATRVLRKLSFAFSFDTSRGNQTSSTSSGTPMNVFTGDKQQLSSYSVRFEPYNKRDPRDKTYKRDWEDFLSQKAVPLATALNKLTSDILFDKGKTPGDPTTWKWRDQALQLWYEETQQALSNAATADVEKVFRNQLNELPIDKLSPGTAAEISRLEKLVGVYLQGRDDVLNKIAKGAIVSFEFTDNRQVNAPDLLNFMLIAETGFGGKADLTFNSSVTVFDKKPASMNVDRLRDFQLSSQLDIPFGSAREGIGKIVLSFAGRFQRLMEDAMTPDGMTMINTKGDIAVGQLKLTIPIKGLGVKLPISVTFANRTELIKEKEIRGNIGFTFDLDSLFAKFRP